MKNKNFVVLVILAAVLPFVLILVQMQQNFQRRAAGFEYVDSSRQLDYGGNSFDRIMHMMNPFKRTAVPLHPGNERPKVTTPPRQATSTPVIPTKEQKPTSKVEIGIPEPIYGEIVTIAPTGDHQVPTVDPDPGDM